MMMNDEKLKDEEDQPKGGRYNLIAIHSTDFTQNHKRDFSSICNPIEAAYSMT